MADYSIINCIRTDKPIKRNGKYPIYLRVRVFRKETKVPTNLDVEQDRWDAKIPEPKDKALLIQLNKKKTELDIYINRALVDGQQLTIELIKEFYSGKHKMKPENESFYSYYLDFVERKRIKDGDKSSTLEIQPLKDSSKFFHKLRIKVRYR